MGIGLSGEEFINETLLVVLSKALTPPRKRSLISDRRGGNRTQGLAAGASRAVRGQNLDVVWQRQELIPKATKEIFRALKIIITETASSTMNF